MGLHRLEWRKGSVGWREPTSGSCSLVRVHDDSATPTAPTDTRTPSHHCFSRPSSCILRLPRPSPVVAALLFLLCTEQRRGSKKNDKQGRNDYDPFGRRFSSPLSRWGGVEGHGATCVQDVSTSGEIHTPHNVQLQQYALLLSRARLAVYYARSLIVTHRVLLPVLLYFQLCRSNPLLQIAMPNLKPPVTTTDEALDYRQVSIWYAIRMRRPS